MVSAIEDTLERIKGQQGVEGYVICNREGVVLRRMASMSQGTAENYARHMNEMATKARHVTRDLDPEDELKNLRIRTKTKEVILSHSAEFIIIVIQRWTPYS